MTTRPKLSLPTSKKTTPVRLPVLTEALKSSAGASSPRAPDIGRSEEKGNPPRERNIGASIATLRMRKLLVKLWPKCFRGFKKPKQPLQLGIHLLVLEALETDGRLFPQVIMNAIADYVSGPSYLKSQIEGAARIDLNGEAAGAVTAEEAQYAKEQLAKRGVRS